MSQYGDQPPHEGASPYGAPPPGSNPPYGGEQSYGGQTPPPYGGGYGGGGPGGSPPPNYLVWAILSTLFCCPPIGIASIVFAAQVNSKWGVGDVAGAQRSSAQAKKFAIISAVVGLVLAVLYVIFSVAIAANLAETSSTIESP